MRLIILTALLVLSANAGATNYGPKPNDNRADSSSNSHSSAGATAGAAAIVGVKVQSAQAVKNVAEGGQALAKAHGGAGGAGGEAVANGGASNATGGNASNEGVSTTVSTEVPRQAPSVGLVSPNSTAPLMKCIGFGGSNETGSAVIGHCWLQRDLYAEHRANRHAAAKRYEAAAKALCGQRLYRSDFDSKEDCRAQVVQSYINAEIDTNDVVYHTSRANKAEEKAKRLEEALNEAIKPKKPQRGY